MESTGGPTIKVVCEDGDFQLPLAQLLRCGGTLADIHETSDNKSEVVLRGITIPRITTRAFTSLAKYAQLTEHFLPQLAKPLKSLENMYRVTAPVFAEFAESFVDSEELCYMILVANYVNNESLLELLSARLAQLLARLDTAQKREFFGITRPFENPEREAEVIKENEEATELYQLQDE